MAITCEGIRGARSATGDSSTPACGGDRGAERRAGRAPLTPAAGPLIISKYGGDAGPEKARSTRGGEGRGHSASGGELGEGCAGCPHAADSGRVRAARRDGRGPAPLS